MTRREFRLVFSLGFGVIDRLRSRSAAPRSHPFEVDVEQPVVVTAHLPLEVLLLLGEILRPAPLPARRLDALLLFVKEPVPGPHVPASRKPGPHAL